MVKIGVIGTVEQLRSYARYFQLTDGIILSGVLYTDKETLATNVPIFQTPEDLYQNSDAVYIFPSPADHFATTRNAIQNGKHIYLEQISGLSLTEIEQLLKSCKEANVKCMGGCPELCHPSYLSAKKEIDNPLFIEVSRRQQHNAIPTGNLITELMLKDITMVMDIVKSDIKRIRANGIRVMSDQYNLVNARLEFFNGCVAILTTQQNLIGNESRINLYDEHKIVELDLDKLTSRVTRKDRTGLTTVSLPLQAIDHFSYQLENFRDSILSNAEPVLSLRSSFEKADIALKILKKINSFSEE